MLVGLTGCCCSLAENVGHFISPLLCPSGDRCCHYIVYPCIAAGQLWCLVCLPLVLPGLHGRGMLIIVVIIITFKGAIQDFSQPPHCTANCLSTHTLQQHGRIHVQIMCNTSSAHHVQYVVLRTMLYKGAAQLLNFDRVLSRIYFSFILLAEPLNL